MPLVRTIRSRGANIVVEAHGEVLFAPGGPVNGWTRRFTQRARAFTASAAPTNKRPRWSHYGKPLKATIKGSTRPRQGINKFHLYAAVGSSAPHAVYVDQGTGIYGGKGPYRAKILPPWEQGSPSLYEHTWHPPGQAATGDRFSVMIRGQQGQHFFDKGLDRAFKSMRMRSFQVPGEGVSGLSGILNSAPSGLLNFLGSTPANGAFIQQLAQWREWRQEHFDSGRVMGRNTFSGAEAERRAARLRDSRERRRQRGQANRTRRAQLSKQRSQARRDRLKSLQKPKPTKTRTDAKARRVDQTRFLMAMQKKYGVGNVDRASLRFLKGYWYVLVRRVTETKGGDLRPEWVEVRAKAKV